MSMTMRSIWRPVEVLRSAGASALLAGLCCAATSAASGTAAAPSSQPNAAPPPRAIVRALCASHAKGIGIYPWRWSYLDGYLLCRDGGGRTEVATLYRRDSVGEFTLVREAVGAPLTAEDLADDGVPPAEAKALDAAIHR